MTLRSGGYLSGRLCGLSLVARSLSRCRWLVDAAFGLFAVRPATRLRLWCPDAPEQPQLRSMKAKDVANLIQQLFSNFQ